MAVSSALLGGVAAGAAGASAAAAAALVLDAGGTACKSIFGKSEADSAVIDDAALAAACGEMFVAEASTDIYASIARLR
jgi:hypothetical protein